MAEEKKSLFGKLGGAAKADKTAANPKAKVPEIKKAETVTKTTGTSTNLGAKLAAEAAAKKATNLGNKLKIEAVAKEVIEGKWGNGTDRKAALEKAGYDYAEIQNKVNEIMLGAPAAANVKLEDIAKEVIQGKWGNGADRKAALEKAGYDAVAVQNKVNELLSK